MFLNSLMGGVIYPRFIGRENQNQPVLYNILYGVPKFLIHCKFILTKHLVTRVATNIDNGHIVIDGWYCGTLTCACPYIN